MKTRMGPTNATRATLRFQAKEKFLSGNRLPLDLAPEFPSDVSGCHVAPQRCRSKPASYPVTSRRTSERSALRHRATAALAARSGRAHVDHTEPAVIHVHWSGPVVVRREHQVDDVLDNVGVAAFPLDWHGRLGDEPRLLGLACPELVEGRSLSIGVGCGAGSAFQFLHRGEGGAVPVFATD